MRLEELQHVGVGAEPEGHGAGHLVVVHPLRQLDDDPRVGGHRLVAEGHLHPVKQISGGDVSSAGRTMAESWTKQLEKLTSPLVIMDGTAVVNISLLI